MAGLFDVEKEVARLNKQRAKIEKDLQGVEAQLNNPKFLEKASQVGEGEREGREEGRGAGRKGGRKGGIRKHAHTHTHTFSSSTPGLCGRGQGAAGGS
jgi:hypothetical protein